MLKQVEHVHVRRISGANGRTAKSGDILKLFGTGFGPTDPAVAPGAVGPTAAPLTNPVTITIGGVEAAVSFAGLSMAGLYQLNIAVPHLADGDHEVIARIAGLQTQSGVLLKTRSQAMRRELTELRLTRPEFCTFMPVLSPIPQRVGVFFECVRLGRGR